MDKQITRIIKRGSDYVLTPSTSTTTPYTSRNEWKNFTETGINETGTRKTQTTIGTI